MKNAAIAMGAVAGTSVLTSDVQAQTTSGKRRVIGINTSHRSGMTCTAGLKIVLDAAQEADANLETELIELADIEFAQAVVGVDQPKDALDVVLEKIASPNWPDSFPEIFARRRS